MRYVNLVQNVIGPTIRIGREILCLPYAGFFILFLLEIGPILLNMHLNVKTAEQEGQGDLPAISQLSFLPEASSAGPKCAPSITH